MILPARSIPPPTPSMRINMQIIKAPICHPLFPNAEAILPKAFPYSSTLFGARVEPVRVPIAYLKIQPITTVYPIAIAREPRTGIMPRASPSFRLPFASQAQPNASTGPDLVARPKLISAMTPVKPMRATKNI